MQAAADAAYTALLRGTLETAGGTAADDRAALRAGGSRRARALHSSSARRRGCCSMQSWPRRRVESQLLTSFLVHASVHVFSLVQYQLSLPAFLNQESWHTCSEPQAAYLMLRFMWREFITRAPGARGRAPGAAGARGGGAGAGAHTRLRLGPTARGEIGGIMYILYVTHAPTRARRAPPMPRPGRGRARGPGAGRGAPTTVPPGPVPPPPRRRAPLRPPPRPQRHGATPKLPCSLYSSSSSSSSSCVKSVHVGHSPSSSSASDRCASPKTFRG